MTQLLDNGSVGASSERDKVHEAVRSIRVEAAGVTYRIEVRGDTVKFERARGVTVTLPLSAVLASSALLFQSPAMHNTAALTLGWRPKQRPHPPRAGAAWSISEDATLRQEWSAGGSIQGLAHAHGRTKVAIHARLEKLGLIKLDERQSELFPGPKS
jgi:hypothetical protein